jgi:hypothetical protein
MTEKELEERTARTVRMTELAITYQVLEERAAQLQHDRETFYADVALLAKRFSPDSLAARLGLSRDAVYKWASKGRKVLSERQT